MQCFMLLRLLDLGLDYAHAIQDAASVSATLCRVDPASFSLEWFMPQDLAVQVQRVFCWCPFRF